jgi:nickel-dependent lactate racemase
MLFEKGSAHTFLSAEELRDGLMTALGALGTIRKMLIVPPDITRLQSRAGMLTRIAYQRDPAAVSAILPALGTHCPMSEREVEVMYGDLPRTLFRAHNWRTGCAHVGAVPADFVNEVSVGAVDYPVPVNVNRLLFEKNLDCILSISQVVPHEVAGMAGGGKNLFVGVGGAENIHKSHFLGAAYGIERIMGKVDSPVRKVIDYAIKKFLSVLPIVHAITVVGRDADGTLKTRGLFVGRGEECYRRAAALSRKINIHVLPKPLNKVVVYLDPVEYKSTWLGNKSIYRTRMAIADGGELIVVAPGVKCFGEDGEIDRLIRKFGYRGTPLVMEQVKTSEELKNNLSAAAHLIHGSSEGRFSITYCPGGLNKQEVEGAGFGFAAVGDMLKRYNPAVLVEGTNTLPNGEEIYFISNPAIGLWTCG